jgi:flagellar basal body rod protein FlgG
MLYGLYLSATGIVTSSHKQDVVANNLANSESTGFKRDVATFQQRLTEATVRGRRDLTNPLLEQLGGGILASPTLTDNRQGDLESTGNPLDVAIEGDGYFAVLDKGESRLTRNGQFAVDRQGRLILSNGVGQPVLDPAGRPVRIAPGQPATIGPDGAISQGGQEVGRVGLFDVADPRQLVKRGGTLLAHPGQSLVPGAGALHSEYVERANVDPATELAELMETQRQLEANANMIRYQDQTLAKLVNEVGKIG